MAKTFIKNVIQKALQHFGFAISNARNAFAVQRELIKVGEPIIFDVGAHHGETAMIYRSVFPSSLIHCFEPFPPSFEILLKNRAADNRCFCYRTAVSEKDGKAVLNSNLSSSTNSLLTTDKRGSFFWGQGLLDTASQVEVTTTTIDAFSLERGVPHIDILKMDVQGAELSLLSGAKDTLSKQKISLIYNEIIMCPTYEGQNKLHEYLAFLDSFGYELLDFFNPVRRRNQLVQADLIFLSSSFKAGIY